MAPIATLKIPSIRFPLSFPTHTHLSSKTARVFHHSVFFCFFFFSINEVFGPGYVHISNSVIADHPRSYHKFPERFIYCCLTLRCCPVSNSRCSSLQLIPSVTWVNNLGRSKTIPKPRKKKKKCFVYCMHKKDASKTCRSDSLPRNIRTASYTVCTKKYASKIYRSDSLWVAKVESATHLICFEDL